MKKVKGGKWKVEGAGASFPAPHFPLTTLHVPLHRWLLIAVVVLVLTVLPSDLLAQGCSMCKAVVEDGTQGNSNVFGGQQSIGNGLNSGIIVLMVVPYVLLFLFFRKRIVGFFKEFAGAQG